MCEYPGLTAFRALFLCVGVMGKEMCVWRGGGSGGGGGVVTLYGAAVRVLVTHLITSIVNMKFLERSRVIRVQNWISFLFFSPS